MAAVEIGQLPLTTSIVNTTFIPIENANVTQKIEAISLKSYMTTLPTLTVEGNVAGANLSITGQINTASLISTGNVNGSVFVSTASGVAPLNVASSIQVPNLYASRAALADVTTNGLTTESSFGNTTTTDVIISGNNSTISANLRTVNTNVGSFGNTATVPQLTVDAKGRITAVSNVAITFPSQTLISNTSEITANTVSGTPGLNLTTTGVSAGTYGGAINVPQITVDSKGRITNITSIPVNSTLNTLNIGIPIGTIAMWSGSLASIPDGWQLADGTNGTVDLRNRFVVGAGTAFTQGATGGSANAVVAAHTHTATSVSTFTGNALGTHAHGITDPGHNHGMAYAGLPDTFNGTQAVPARSAQNNYSAFNWSASTGISITGASAGTPAGVVTTTTTNSTEGVSATGANLPPYYALYYIQKITDAVSINNPINYMATLGNIIAGGNLVAASGNVSVSTTTGALVVVGGAGVSGNLNVGGLANFASTVSVTGSLTAPTVPAGTSNTHVATTSFVSTALATLSFKANLDSPAFTGLPTAPTMPAGTSNTAIATTAFVAGSFAGTSSPSFTGTPTAPTAALATNTTQLATTAYLQNNAIGGAGYAWTSVSRSAGTTYQNTTGRPIQVSVGMIDGNHNFQVSTDGSSWITLHNFSYYGRCFNIIPNGIYYRMTSGGGWSYELR